MLLALAGKDLRVLARLCERRDKAPFVDTLFVGLRPYAHPKSNGIGAQRLILVATAMAPALVLEATAAGKEEFGRLGVIERRETRRSD